jgi:hypothetical protein
MQRIAQVIPKAKVDAVESEFLAFEWEAYKPADEFEGDYAVAKG